MVMSHMTPGQGIPLASILNPKTVDMELMGCPTCHQVLDNAARCPHCDENQCYVCLKDAIEK